jgi:superfamily II DNA or RNA helicase
MLRNYQTEFVQDIYSAWNAGARNVIATAATGSGKTVVMGHIVKGFNVPSIAIAHRQELVSQFALMLNREHVPHSIIAPSTIIRQIVALEMDTHGFSQYNPRSSTRVAGVDTLIRKVKTRERWMDETQLTIVDEGHHTLANNKWGTAVDMFPNARGLFLTAHALRGDNKGLGRNADGLADALVIGPNAKFLIEMGMLCPYRLICPTSDVNLDAVHTGASGEFNQDEVRAAVHASPTIVGDVVATYLKFAAGKLGITFAVDIESATEIAAAYRAAGVPAEIITGETPLEVRGALMRQFRERRILQLVSVDVLGEGVDVPAVEVVSMARPTASFQLFAQQTGRALRLLISDELTAVWNDLTDEQRKAHIAASPKPSAILIDHVQNWLRHGLPDTPREYTLDRRERKSKSSDGIPLRSCLECLRPYERYLTKCPYCGAPVPLPAARSTPAQVEGDMCELDPEVLRALEAEKKRVDGPPVLPFGVTVAHGKVKHAHYSRQQSQQELREVMALYMGWLEQLDHGHREAQKRFYLTFGTDVLSAQALNAQDADALRERIQAILTKQGVYNAVKVA